MYIGSDFDRGRIVRKSGKCKYLDISFNIDSGISMIEFIFLMLNLNDLFIEK